MRIIGNGELPNNGLIIYEELKKMIIILISIIRLYLLDLFIKLSLDLKIELHECSKCFSFYNNSFYSNIIDEVICEDDEITRLIL